MLPLSPNSVLPIYTYMCNPSKFIASSVRIFTSFIITFALQTPLIYNSPKSHSENTSKIDMSSPKSHRRKHEDKNRKASSFHGRTPETMAVAKLNRPRTVPDLLAGKRVTGVSSSEGKPTKLTKLLLNVTVQRSLGAVMVIMSPESTVGDLIAAVIRQYVKEGRRPILGSTDCGDFDLHYSQFSLESLDREEKLLNLGSRNFFLCPRKLETTTESGAGKRPIKCSEEAEEEWMTKIAWLKLMELLL